MEKTGTDWLELPLLIVLCVLPILIFCTIIHFAGPQWDIMVRSLSGQAMVNFFTHHASLQAAFGGEAYHGSDNLLYYFEPYREPLATPIFALLYLLFGHSVLAYMILVYLLYLIAIHELGKELGLKRLVAFSVMLNGYVVYFLFVPNGGEGLSVVLVLLGIVYLLRKRPESGLFLGLASLAKYPSIILFPLVLLLGDRKKIAKAVALEAAMVALWGAMDYLIYGMPFYSYIESLGASGVVSRSAAISLGALLGILGYPILFLAIGAAVILYLRRSRITIRLDYKWKVMLSAIALSAVCYVIIAPHNDSFTQARYGYLLAISSLLAAAVVVEAAVKKREGLKYAISVLALIILAYALYSAYTSTNSAGAYYYNPDNPGSIYAHAAAALAGQGFGGCRFISNTWVPMIYSGYDAYSPFILYTSNATTFVVNQTLAKFGISTKGALMGIMNDYLAHNATYAAEEARYPILIFNYDGVPASDVPNLGRARQVYSEQNLSIYLPANATCYKTGNQG